MRQQSGILTVSLGNADLDDIFVARHPSISAGRFLRLTVNDTGVGIQPEIMGLIFDLYH